MISVAREQQEKNWLTSEGPKKQLKNAYAKTNYLHVCVFFLDLFELDKCHQKMKIIPTKR